MVKVMVKRYAREFGASVVDRALGLVRTHGSLECARDAMVEEYVMMSTYPAGEEPGDYDMVGRLAEVLHTMLVASVGQG